MSFLQVFHNFYLIKLHRSHLLTLGVAFQSWKQSDESFLHRINEKELLIADKDKVIFSQEQSLAELRAAEESYAQTLSEKNRFISEQTASIEEYELSLAQLREELVHVGQTAGRNITQQLHDKDSVIAERDCSIVQLEDTLKSAEEKLCELQQQATAKESELGRVADELEASHNEVESYKLELETCRGELLSSRQKEQMSSGEILQLMGVVEDLQKRVHRDSLSESDSVQRLREESGRQLEQLRAELDEVHGEQIVQMKREMNVRHAADVERLSAEIERWRTQLSDAAEESQAALAEAAQEKLDHQEKVEHLHQEKLNLQTKVEHLHQEKVELQTKVEHLLKEQLSRSEERHQEELQSLLEVIDKLKADLTAAGERAQEAESKHDSEITNYKIKLEMLEREKDAVLDRMAESQEAELERLRTQLLFSHEEELAGLRQELQRESFLNAENLLNEATVRHRRALDELVARGDEKLRALHREKAASAAERDELVHQITGLKEDLKLALHSSKADELVQQLRELQVELDELKREGSERARLEGEVQKMAKRAEALEAQLGGKERHWREKCDRLQEELDSERRRREEVDKQVEDAVEGRSSPHKSTASGSNRRKRRQRSKQERKATGVQSDCREREGEEELEEGEEGEERATSAAEPKSQPQMESRLAHLPQRASEEDSADGCERDGGGEKQVRATAPSSPTTPFYLFPSISPSLLACICASMTC